MADVADIRLNSHEAAQDIFLLYARLRSRNGTVWSRAHKAWLVSSYDSARAVLTHPNASVEKVSPFVAHASGDTLTQMLEMQAIMKHWLPFLDPPSHTRMRRMLQKSFLPPAIQAHAEMIRDVTRQVLKGISDRREIEFMEDFAAQIPAFVIAHLFELPLHEVPRIRAWSAGVAELVLGSANPDRHANTAAVLQDMRSYLTSVVEERSRAKPSANPNTLMANLFEAQRGADGMTNEEIVATLTLLLFAAPETTSNLILNGMLLLVTHEEQLQKLRDDPALVPVAVEEMLRNNGPVPAVVRVAKAEFQLDGETIKAGDRIFVLLKSANRDERKFDDAASFDLDRGRSSHMGFGTGIHMCLGAALARLETKIALEEFLGHFPTIRLADQQIEWRDELIAHSPKALRLEIAR